MTLICSIVSSALKVSPFQRRATRLNASVPPLRCCHPARASRATPQQKTIVFASGASISCRRRAQSVVVVLRPVVSLPFLAHWQVFCSSTSLFLGTCLFTASIHCRGISSMSAVSQREPSASIKLKPLRTDSNVFFFLVLGFD